MTDAVPTLDARSTQDAQFARDLSAAYEEYGFVIIRNHGIEKHVIDRCLACFRQFFALPVEEKRRYQLPAGGGARGYTPFGIETAKGAQHHDLKEFWQIGHEPEPGAPPNPFSAPNVWPEAPAAFEAAFTS